MLKKRKKSVSIVILVILTVMLLSCGKAYAGKSWSDQLYSKESGMVVLGGDDKFEKVYGISVPDMKVKWTVGMPKSLSVSISQDNNIVYLVAAEDTGLKSNLKAVDLTTGQVKWERRLVDHFRKSKVYIEGDTLYVAMEQKFRDVTYVKLYALDKATGKEKWTPFSIIAAYKNLIKTENGDLVLVVQPVKDGKVQESLLIVKIDKNTGAKTWKQIFEGSAFASDPQENSNKLYFITQIMKEGKNIRTFYTLDEEKGSITSSQSIPEEDKPLGNIQFYREKAVILTEAGRLICLNGGTSDPSQLIAWQINLGSMPYSTPIIQDDKVFVSIVKIHEDETKTYTIIAISAETGQELWKHEVDGILENEFIVDGNKLILGCRNRVQPGDEKKKREEQPFQIIALDTNNGSESWKIEDKGKLDSEFLLKNGILYVQLVGTSEQDGKQYKGHLLNTYDVQNGSKKWSFVSFSKIKTNLYIDEDSVDFGTENGNMISIDLTNGTKIIDFSAGDNNEVDSELAQNGNLIGFATAKGKYFVIDKQKGTLMGVIDLKPWFADWKFPILIGCLMLSASISWFIYQARKGKALFVRRIAGLTAIDEAVGRSTEMGKPVLYITGLADVDDIQTLASLSILGHIAQKTAEYDTPLVVPCCRSVVMSTAQEVVKESYMKAGRPDTYRAENIHYLTDDQFGYVAGVDGIMVREKPAANFYMGKFYAESLILAETGHSTGAIQIAGTAEASQLPFFVAACDYTLIGEELFAASAYLSNDPLQVGSLKGQDFAKAIILLAIAGGCLLVTFGMDWVRVLFMTR